MILATLLYILGVIIWFLWHDSVWEGQERMFSIISAIIWPVLAVWIVVELAKGSLEDL